MGQCLCGEMGESGGRVWERFECAEMESEASRQGAAKAKV